MNTATINKDDQHKILGFIKFSKKNLMIVIAVWFFGAICSVLALTNLLIESPFQKKNIIVIWLFISSSVTVYKMIIKTYNIKISIELK